ncbi:MAG: ribosome-associated translation inhibitor RaiA [Armatimonadota bacterium]|nr:MAG: ribosome-associated translation inhibitor RaiA [Armatimonadota bacterium]
MQINLTAKGVAVPRGMKEIAERKLAKLQRLLRQIDTVDITCSRERQWRVVEIAINANGLLVRGEDRAIDLRSAIDNLVDKLERRIKKSRSKLLQRYREHPETRDAWQAAIEEEIEAAPEPGLVRSKRFPVKPMNPEEAAAQMELLGHDFYVFRNAETEQVNVLYRRKDGNYGLIEPEF